MKGKIEKIETKSGTKNGRKWTLYLVDINGETYSKFNNFKFDVGDYVEFDFNQNGKFKTITNIEKVKQQENKNVNDDVRQLMIVRQSSLKAAIDILVNNLDVNRVKAIAELLTKYVTDGIEDNEFEELLEDYLQEVESVNNAEDNSDNKEDEDIPF